MTIACAHRQGYVNAAATTHYTCLKDVLSPPPPPPGQRPACDETPWLKCRTGCPPGGACAGGKTPPPRPGATCNRCACNIHNTSCDADDGPLGHPCQPGWYPDPLLEVPPQGILIPKAFTQPILVEVCIPYDQAAGNYSGAFEVTAASGTLFSVPVALEVWDISLPRLGDDAAFNTAFTFTSTEQAPPAGCTGVACPPGCSSPPKETEPAGCGALRNYYPQKTDAELWSEWCAHPCRTARQVHMYSRTTLTPWVVPDQVSVPREAPNPCRHAL